MQSPKMKLCVPLLLLCFAGLAAFGVAPDSTRSGNWIIKHSDVPGKVDFALSESHRGSYSSQESDWPLSAFQGLDITRPGRQDVRFTIVRDAGKFDCEGFLDNGEGAGLFHFYPDAKYPAAMQALGFSGIDQEKQFSMALHDVSLTFAKEMQNQHLQGLDTDKLIAFRIFDVNAGFIQELRAAGLKATDSDKLVAFRIHGVTPEMVRYLHQAGSLGILYRFSQLQDRVFVLRA